MNLAQAHSPGVSFDALDWTRVSPVFMRVRLAQRILWTVGMVAVCSVPLVGDALVGWGLPAWCTWGLAGGMLVYQLVLCVLVPRQISALGYVENDTHLILTRGLLRRQIITVPYGRMQYVDVKYGPLESLFKLARVELKTASVGTTAVIRGVSRAEAQRLREVFTVRGQEQMVLM